MTGLASFASGRIAILLPDLRPGGVERMRVHLAHEWVRRGWDVDIVLLRRQGELLAALPGTVRIFELGVQRYRNALAPIRDHLRRTRPAVLLAAMWPLTSLAVLAARLSGTGVRVVVSDHSILSESYRDRGALHRAALRASAAATYRFADQRIAVSSAVAADLAALSGLPAPAFRVIHNPAAIVPSPADAEHVVPSELASVSHPIILTVGTLKPVKDHALLIEAFSRLPPHLGATLCILGEGTLREPLIALARSRGIEDRVLLPGFRPDTAAWYRNADLFVLSSRHEGFGNVIVEALSHGLDVVSTDCPGGPREILADGRFGRLVPPGDPDALTEAMMAALATPADKQSLKRRAQDFSVASIADAYLRIMFPDSGLSRPVSKVKSSFAGPSSDPPMSADAPSTSMTNIASPRRTLQSEPELKVLYITYTGLTEPIGGSQILPYLRALAKRGVAFEVISFEPSPICKQGADEIRQLTGDLPINIRFFERRNEGGKRHRAWRLFKSLRQAADYSRQLDFDVIHCRNAFAAELAMSISRRSGIPYLFDMRGFWGDARAQTGAWNQATSFGRMLYRAWKQRERRYIQRSGMTNVLTRKAKDWIASEGLTNPDDVIVTPCCVDLSRARAALERDSMSIRERIGLGPTILACVYTGSYGGVYDDRRMLAAFSTIRRHTSAKLILLGKRDPQSWIDAAERFGIRLDAADLICRSVANSEVFDYLAAADVGFSFCHPSFYATGVSSTKIGEYASVGLPFIGNAGIGDLAAIGKALGGSLILPDDPSDDARRIVEFVDRLHTIDRADLARQGQQLFAIDKATDNYLQAYARIRSGHRHD